MDLQAWAAGCTPELGASAGGAGGQGGREGGGGWARLCAPAPPGRAGPALPYISVTISMNKLTFLKISARASLGRPPAPANSDRAAEGAVAVGPTRLLACSGQGHGGRPGEGEVQAAGLGDTGLRRLQV